MNRVIFNFMVSAFTFVVCFATGYWMEFPTVATTAVGSLFALVTFSAMTFASWREEPSGNKRRVVFLVTGVMSAALATMHMLEPYVRDPEDISWRGIPVLFYILSALMVAVALNYNREAGLD